jgi:Uma2 family endonuclease
LNVAEFLVWDSEDRSGRRWQLRDGVPEPMSISTDSHGSIHAKLGALIGDHLRASASPCRVICLPGIVPRVRGRDNFRIPELGVTCSPPHDGQVTQAPVLLVEILSPSNADETWANVWSFATIPSVREILVISNTAVTADLLRRDPTGAWPEAAARVEAGGMLALDSIGPELPLTDVYRTTNLV